MRLRPDEPLCPLLYEGSCSFFYTLAISPFQLCNDMYVYVMDVYVLMHVCYDDVARACEADARAG